MKWNRPLVFLDTETGGLRYMDQAWEIAMLRRTRMGSEERMLIHVTDFLPEKAEPEALKIGRFAERWKAGGDEAWMREEDALGLVAQWTYGATLVGVAPSYDARVLTDRMRLYGITPAWHHRLKCVASQTEVLAQEEMYSLQRTAEWHGVEVHEDDLHTAMGDVLLTAAVWDKMFGEDKDMTEPGYVLDRDDRGLTKRERDVFNLLLKGWTWTQIAEELGVTKQRVGAIVSSLRKKGYVSGTGDDLMLKVDRRRKK